MTKILYIGHYKENSGWSNAAINNILAADRVGLDVVTRNIKLTNSQSSLNKEFLKFEEKSLNNIEYCIQHVLPHHLVGTNKFKKNIAYFAGESNTLKYSHWLTYLKLVDEVWVPNNDLKESLLNDGIKNVRTLCHAFDLEKYEQSTMKINFTNNEYKYKFYYIGELNDRKNIESIIRCFHSEFHISEPVCLVLKIKKFGINNKDLHNHITNMCSQIKKEMRIYNSIDQYHKELIISEDLNDEQIYSLHNSCDCFVSPSHGEGWSIPAFDAMCFGKTPICSNEGGPKSFIDSSNKNTGTLINGIYNICNHSDPAFPELFTGNEEWFIPSEKEIKKAMRFYYENRNNIDRSAGLKLAEKCSFKNIGNQIKEYLDA